MAAIGKDDFLLVLLENAVVLVSFALNLLADCSAIGNLAAINGVVHDSLYKVGGEFAYIIAGFDFFRVPLVQLLSHIGSALVGADIQFKGITDNRCFILYNLKLSVL